MTKVKGQTYTARNSGRCLSSPLSPQLKSTTKKLRKVMKNDRKLLQGWIEKLPFYLKNGTVRTFAANEHRYYVSRSMEFERNVSSYPREIQTLFWCVHLFICFLTWFACFVSCPFFAKIRFGLYIFFYHFSEKSGQISFQLSLCNSRDCQRRLKLENVKFLKIDFCT